ncbi:DUF1800 domain-containing protein [Roseiconus lacunae]|uniref:DUF1800 domain-containing protein n=1 Tax=Roseiconus lacunae TaxID=2605694 RepID=UPI0011F33E4E|nr:DUF1800 domain-containing protein [Roseiconus lacunae]
MPTSSHVMIDPQWAWEPYTPSDDQPWDARTASHLLRRSGFAPNATRLQTAVQEGFSNTFVSVTELQGGTDRFDSEMDLLAGAATASGSLDQLAAGWLYRMQATPSPLLEKMTLFWHGHFATSASKVQDASLMQQQNALLRQNALGHFRELLLGISRDPAMLIYLDSATNRKSHPNENYAREIMELFCLGEGNYTETDIREIARCFTGWEIKRKRFRFNRYQHDNGTKAFLGQSGDFGGEDAVRIIADQDAAAMFLCSKLVRFFVADELLLSPSVIEPLAEKMREDDLQIAPTVRRILGSNLFFSSHARASKIRSPVEYALDFLSAFEGSTDNYMVTKSISNLGQGLYHPPSVKGWDGGRAWINSSTLVGRANLVRQILDHKKSRFGKRSLEEYLAGHDVRRIDDLIDFVEPLLFATRLPTSARDRVHAIAKNNSTTGQSGFADALHLLGSLPEFQLS